ncbi:MAG: penicillin-binding transpeptidase domain-containing protein [Candidatus Paceibacterota bacterium]|jgi:penicillin-binding protein 2
MFSLFHRRKKYHTIEPEEIFIDSRNLPMFDPGRFQGRLEKSIGQRTVVAVGVAFTIIALIYIGKIWNLQITDGTVYATKSETNRLRHLLVFPERGTIYDRYDELLAWNEGKSIDGELSLRRYSPLNGLAHLVGYLKYPAKDTAGFYYQENFEGMDAAEKFFNGALAGQTGRLIVEVDVAGKTTFQNTFLSPVNGADLKLSIDAKLSDALYGFIKNLASEVGFEGGAGGLMDVRSGEMLALVSFPEYSQQVMTAGTDKDAFAKILNDQRNPFLNRFIAGLYTPGSTVKPFVAAGALTEKIITPDKKILSTGSISIPNPYDKTQESVFVDWKAHGWVDMRQALAVSSNVYFYEVGGGFEEQPGLGISRIEKYLRMFGFGRGSANPFFGDTVGTIPNPEWKAENFEDGVWRLGDTYHTAIGQYGVQVTPLQMLKAVAAIANGGQLMEPTILLDDNTWNAQKEKLPVAQEDLQVIREGLRQGVQTGIASALNIPAVKVAAKTGTAELGFSKQFVNSWVTGFFPYDNPHYAFVVIMEKGPRANTIGSTYIMRQLLEWLTANRPEYLE